MRTTEQWWEEIISDGDKLVDWLKDQYHGEVTAAERISALIEDYNLTGSVKKIITRIAADEVKHAEWVKSLLIKRGITAEVLTKEERYWSKVLPKEEVTFERICAVGHLAEVMRLDRIRLLAKNKEYLDIAEVFERIISDEEFHAAAFGKLSTPEDIEDAKKFHEDGLNAIGLVA